MTESSDKSQKEAKAPSSAGDLGEKGSAAKQQQQAQVQVDDSKATSGYANFFRVAGLPEELILDFGVGTQPFGATAQPISVSQRVILNYYTAKRMLHALQLAVQRHEAAFGVLEIDIQKRVRPGAMAGAAMPPTSP